MKGPPAKTFIYAIYAPACEQIKIGVSYDPSQRLRDFQPLHGSRLQLLAQSPGTVCDERRIHQELADYRLLGEWFRECPAVMAAVAKIKEMGEGPVGKRCPRCGCLEAPTVEVAP